MTVPPDRVHKICGTRSKACDVPLGGDVQTMNLLGCDSAPAPPEDAYEAPKP